MNHREIWGFHSGVAEDSKLLGYDAMSVGNYITDLFIVILQQYVFRQHNNIRINVLLKHVSTQESHRQADYLRTVTFTVLYM